MFAAGRPNLTGHRDLSGPVEVIDRFGDHGGLVDDPVRIGTYIPGRQQLFCQRTHQQQGQPGQHQEHHDLKGHRAFGDQQGSQCADCEPDGGQPHGQGLAYGEHDEGNEPEYTGRYHSTLLSVSSEEIPPPPLS